MGGRVIDLTDDEYVQVTDGSNDIAYEVSAGVVIVTTAATKPDVGEVGIRIYSNNGTFSAPTVVWAKSKLRNGAKLNVIDL